MEKVKHLISAPTSQLCFYFSLLILTILSLLLQQQKIRWAIANSILNICTQWHTCVYHYMTSLSPTHQININMGITHVQLTRSGRPGTHRWSLGEILIRWNAVQCRRIMDCLMVVVVVLVVVWFHGYISFFCNILFLALCLWSSPHKAPHYHL